MTYVQDMLHTIFLRATGMLLDPVGTFRASGDDSTGLISWYLLAIYLVNAVFTVLLTAAGITAVNTASPQSAVLVSPAARIILIPVAGIVGTFLLSAWIHVWTWLSGGRKTLDHTTRATAYSSTPAVIFGWIPFIGMLLFFWSLVLLVLGIREIQELSTTRALLAVAGAVLVPLVIIVTAFLLFLMPVTSVTTVVGP